jgi:DNA topoisomerase-1
MTKIAAVDEAPELPPDLPPDLTYSDDTEPGIRRRERRGGWTYLDPGGKAITDERTLKRIKALAIPPAWEDVWISPDASGHIQATGRDARRRKQYRYHPRWREARDRSKYDKMIDFGRALPKLRARLDEDLSRRGLPKEKVVAAVVKLLELTLMRVGNDEYAKENKSFGLTTLRKRHVDIGSTGAMFEFKGKSGVAHRTGFRDRRLARVIQACGDLPGQRLFQYVDADGERRVIGSADVNAYIRGAMGEEFSAKDFRTWAGALIAAETFDAMPPPTSATQAKAQVRECVKRVSRRLGNTPAVCRACYIHPLVIEAFETGALKPLRSGADPERRLIRLLESGRPKKAA